MANGLRRMSRRRFVQSLLAVTGGMVAAGCGVLDRTAPPLPNPEASRSSIPSSSLASPATSPTSAPASPTLAAQATAAASPASAPTPAPSAAPAASAPTDAPPSGPTTTPQTAATPAVDPATVAQRYFHAWEGRRYKEMYELLSTASRAAISEERFVRRYTAITAEATIQSLSIVAGAPSAPRDRPPDAPQQALVPFTVTMQTLHVGEIREENTLPLVLEGGEWRVMWSPSLIFRDLSGDNLIRLFIDNPPRGSIIDRAGNLLATQTSALELGLIPRDIKDEPAVLAALSEFLGMTQEEVKARYANAEPDWWVSLRELPLTRQAEVTAKLGDLAGIELREVPSRGYPNGPLLQHVLGYVTRYTADDAEQWGPKGYGEGDWIGRAGLEQWGEEYLAGQRGGKLAVVAPSGGVVKIIAEKPAVPGYNLQLTIDIELQRVAEEALGERPGSIVVIDPRDNGILAIASHPTFDPNRFITGWSEEEWKQVSTDPRRPFLPRAWMSAYPTGSIFKVVTMAAALERTDIRPDTVFHCTGQWRGLGGSRVLGDWLPGGHGTLTFQDGLAQSCDIVFYEAGKKLDETDPTLLPAYARAFGLGEPPGTPALTEAAGTVPDPVWKQRTYGQPWFTGDSVNLAIGQGFLEATPLQMANLYSAIASGGLLRSPLLVRRIVDGKNAPVQEFTATERGRVPVSPEHLQAVRDGMKAVVNSERGTAYGAFRGSPIADQVAAKTGAAENQDPNADNTHAWFAAFAPADAPRFVVVVMIEKGGFGGQVAAPTGRRILEAALGATTPPPTD